MVIAAVYCPFPEVHNRVRPRPKQRRPDLSDHDVRATIHDESVGVVPENITEPSGLAVSDVIPK